MLAGIKKHFHKAGNQGFTLNELLIVGAILAVMVGAVVFLVNPGELLAEARDSKRIGELNSLNSAISLHTSSVIGGYKGDSNKVYISLPDTSSTCASHTSLPTLPSGWSYNCVTEANLKNPNGTGWLPMNFDAMPGGSPFNQLPVDPKNDGTATLYYSYVSNSGGYALAALLESEKQAVAAYKDGGFDPGRFEAGTDLSIWGTAIGLAGNWPFEGAGSISNGQTAGLTDLSGNGNNGTALNANGTGMTFTAGKVGNAVQFDGVDDYVNVGNGSSIHPTVNATFSVWVKPGSSQVTYADILGNHSISGFNGYVIQQNGSALNNYYFSYGNGSAWQAAGLIAQLNTNQWNYLVFTKDGSLVKLYLNGAYVSQIGVTGDIVYAVDHPIFIGFGYSSARLFNGLIDDVRIYNRALTASEIRSIYNATK